MAEAVREQVQNQLSEPTLHDWICLLVLRRSEGVRVGAGVPRKRKACMPPWMLCCVVPGVLGAWDQGAARAGGLQAPLAVRLAGV